MIICLLSIWGSISGQWTGHFLVILREVPRIMALVRGLINAKRNVALSLGLSRLNVNSSKYWSTYVRNKWIRKNKHMQILFLMWFLQCFGRKMVWKWSRWNRVGCCTHQLQPEQSSVSADRCVYALNCFMISPSFLKLLFLPSPWNVGLRNGEHNVYTTGYCVFFLVGKLWEEKPHNCIVAGSGWNLLQFPCVEKTCFSF